MWDEWDDNVNTDHEQSDRQQDSHLNFDFLSALSKPKVLYSCFSHPLFISSYFYFILFFILILLLLLFYLFIYFLFDRITIRYWRWIMMLRTIPFGPIISAQLWFVFLVNCRLKIFFLFILLLSKCYYDFTNKLLCNFVPEEMAPG